MQEFEDFLKNQQIRPNTIKEYIPAVERFITWYEEQKESFSIAHLENRHISIEYKNYLLNEKKLHGNTVNKHLAALRKWLEFHQRLGRWKGVIDIRNVVVAGHKTPKWLLKKEVSAILYALSEEKNSFLEARDRCMIYLALYRGLRADEIISCQINDVILTPGRQKILIREGKGGTFSEIDISGSRKLLSAIQDWLTERKESKYARSPYFFISFRSGRPTQGVVDKMIKRLSERSGVDFTMHVLRHTYGYYTQQFTKDIRVTQEAMRHSDIRSTVIYTQPSKEDTQKIYDHIEKEF